MKTPLLLTVLAAGLLAGGATAPVVAQSLAQRVEGGPDGTVRLSFAARPEVQRDLHDQRYIDHGAEWEPDSAHGPIRIAFDVVGHHVVAARFHLGGHWLPGGAQMRDLGTVRAPDAAAYLMDLASRADGEVARHAMASASMADSAVIWPQLLALAKDQGRPEQIRREATFWLSQQAASAATRGLAELAQSDGDRQVRRTAVFALSQRPADEGLPVLERLARDSPDPEVRRQAIFWIGQSHDPRALEFLRGILSGS